MRTGFTARPGRRWPLPPARGPPRGPPPLLLSSPAGGGEPFEAAGLASISMSPAPGLTPQELQIARLAARGLSNREIGDLLFLSHRTVGSTLYHLFPKLGVTPRGQLGGALSR